ncbi:ArsR/SmtB family transcription factor [Roseibium aggregatum]|uniref:Winged helix-turn-helix transcriptional regulator n=1 Tax=Roseibium aggregatum TaxID=187304 RepID=A0A939EGB7_9HYPH|nr:winged helix-turn-helix domain-containing protein [Roseibium aggregatum]MBN9671245.1 winged helix-turn-helix transcriptional regulator [Roseibium aggregatum]
MKDGPDIARIGALIGDPARANILSALMNGKALTATELAAEAGITGQTASSHLKKMIEGGLLSQNKQGRHRYFTLAGPEVGATLEALMGLAARKGHLRTRTGPKDPALRNARVCYDHLAGDIAVRIFDNLSARGFLEASSDKGGLRLSPSGSDFVSSLGIDLAALHASRRPMCRACLDWSERRNHLAGGLGAAMLTWFEKQGWVMREPDSRVVHISARGRSELFGLFPAAWPQK